MVHDFCHFLIQALRRRLSPWEKEPESLFMEGKQTMGTTSGVFSFGLEDIFDALGEKVAAESAVSSARGER